MGDQSIFMRNAVYEYDYEAAYKEIDELYAKDEVIIGNCKRTVRRMYVRLDDLHLRTSYKNLAQPAEVVEEPKILIVYADVVDVATEYIRLPGKEQVIIMCRLLRLKCGWGGSTIRFVHYEGELWRQIMWPNSGIQIWADQVIMYPRVQCTAVFQAYEKGGKKLEVEAKWEVKPADMKQECTLTFHLNLMTRRVPIPIPSLITSSQFTITATHPLNINNSIDDAHLIQAIEDAFSSLESILHRTFVTSAITTIWLHLTWLAQRLELALALVAQNEEGWDTNSINYRLRSLSARANTLLNTTIYIEKHTKIIGKGAYAKLYKNVREIVATRECSEVISMQHMYVLLDDLDVSLFKSPSKVKELIVYADIVEVGKKNLKIPGSTRIIIICRLLISDFPGAYIDLNFPYISNDQNSSPLSLCVSPAMILNWDPTSRVCIYTQQLIVNSRCSYSTSFQRSIPIEVLGDPNVLPLIQASMYGLIYQMSETTSGTPTQDHLHDHLQWLIFHLAQVHRDNHTLEESSLHDLQDLLVHSKLLLKMSTIESKSLIVPSLQYNKYRKLIKKMATTASTYHSQFLLVDLFIQQNQITGDYLLQQNKIFQEKERDVEQFSSLLKECKQRELSAVIQRKNNLLEQLKTQEVDMNQAKSSMDTGITKCKNTEIASAIFSLFQGMIEVGLLISTVVNAPLAPVKTIEVAKKAMEAKETLRNIVKIVKVVEDIYSYFQKLHVLMDIYTYDTTEKLQKDFDMGKTLSKADWEMFENEIALVAEEMPLEVSEVHIWKAKCKNVASVFRELITTTTYINNLEYEIRVEDIAAKIANKQAERLANMRSADLKNYEEMAMQLNVRTTRILTRLHKALRLQNGALLYHYLLPPRSFTNSMSMEEVTSALLSHEEMAVDGLEQLGTPTDTTHEYVVGNIPVALLESGQDWIFTIPVDDYAAFPAYWSRVRIKYVEIRFGEGHSLPSTDSGQVYFFLQASRMFQDRKKGEIIDYEAAVPLDYQFAYKLQTGHATITNKPSYEYKGVFMQMTPFTQWRLRLSSSAYENQGLSFPTATALSSTTQIAITFYLTAIREKSI